MAERAEDAAEAGIGGEECRHLRIGEQMAQLAGELRRFGHQAQERGEVARQLKGRAWPWLSRGGRARCNLARWGRAAFGETGEAGGHAAQPRPDENEERPGKPAPAATVGDGMAQRLDDEGEAVGQRLRGRGHERIRTQPVAGEKEEFAPASTEKTSKSFFCFFQKSSSFPLTSPARYPNTENPASSRADNSAETPARDPAIPSWSAGGGFRGGTSGIRAAVWRPCAGCRRRRR